MYIFIYLFIDLFIYLFIYLFIVYNIIYLHVCVCALVSVSMHVHMHVFCVSVSLEDISGLKKGKAEADRMANDSFQDLISRTACWHVLGGLGLGYRV